MDSHLNSNDSSKSQEYELAGILLYIIIIFFGVLAGSYSILILATTYTVGLEEALYIIFNSKPSADVPEVHQIMSAIIGATFGGLLGYFIARRVEETAVFMWLGKRLDKYSDTTAERILYTTLFVIVVPIGYLLFSDSQEEKDFTSLLNDVTKQGLTTFIDGNPNGKFRAFAEKLLPAVSGGTYIQEFTTIYAGEDTNVVTRDTYFRLSKGYLRRNGSPLLDEMITSFSQSYQPFVTKLEDSEESGFIQSIRTNTDDSISEYEISNSGLGGMIQDTIIIDNATEHDYIFNVKLHALDRTVSDVIKSKHQAMINFNLSNPIELATIEVAREENPTITNSITFQLKDFGSYVIYNIGGRNSYKTEAGVFSYGNQ